MYTVIFHVLICAYIHSQHYWYEELKNKNAIFDFWFFFPHWNDQSLSKFWSIWNSDGDNCTVVLHDEQIVFSPDHRTHLSLLVVTFMTCEVFGIPSYRKYFLRGRYSLFYSGNWHWINLVMRHFGITTTCALCSCLLALAITFVAQPVSCKQSHAVISQKLFYLIWHYHPLYIYISLVLTIAATILHRAISNLQPVTDIIQHLNNQYHCRRSGNWKILERQCHRCYHHCGWFRAALRI